MAKQTDLFNDLPEQRKPTWQDESAADFQEILNCLLRMCQRIRSPHLKDTRKIDSLRRQVKELRDKGTKS